MNPLERDCFIHHENIRIKALVAVFLLWCLPGVAAFFSYHKMLEEAPNVNTERASFWAGVRNMKQHSAYHATGGGGGLSYIYYINSCPRAYDVVRERMHFYISQDPSHAAGILRVF
eukprot:c14769_g1_i1 orf=187-534(+)